MPRARDTQRPINKRPHTRPHPGRIDPAAVETPSILAAIVLIRQVAQELEREKEEERTEINRSNNNEGIHFGNAKTSSGAGG